MSILPSCLLSTDGSSSPGTVASMTASSNSTCSKSFAYFPTTCRWGGEEVCTQPMTSSVPSATLPPLRCLISMDRPGAPVADERRGSDKVWRSLASWTTTGKKRSVLFFTMIVMFFSVLDEFAIFLDIILYYSNVDDVTNVERYQKISTRWNNATILIEVVVNVVGANRSIRQVIALLFKLVR